MFSSKVRRGSLALVFLVYLPLCLQLKIASAQIAVDDFQGNKEVIDVTSNNNTSISGTLAASGALGGYRSYAAFLIEGAAVGSYTAYGTYFHQSYPLARGVTQLVWDGKATTKPLAFLDYSSYHSAPNAIQPALCHETTPRCTTNYFPGSISYNGLGGINFGSAANGDGLALNVVSYDYPNQVPHYIIFNLYDATDLTGKHCSTGAIKLEQQIYSAKSVHLPFDQMTTCPGAAGPADFSKIGAILMQVYGPTFHSMDIVIEWLGNGCSYFDGLGNPVCPTATPTPTNTPTYTSTSTPTATATLTHTPTPTLTSTPTATATQTPTATFTITNTPTITPTRTPTWTPTATATTTNTPTVTPTPTLTATLTPTATATYTFTATSTATPTITPTPVATATTTATNTATPTWTATHTATATSTSTHTPTATGTSTATATSTVTFTASPTPTGTHTATATTTNTATPTQTGTNTATATHTATVTHTSTQTPTSTSTHTATPTETQTSTPTTIPIATATVSTTCTQQIDVCGVCGGIETDRSKCALPENCSLVKPTKEMRKITVDLKKVANLINIRLKDDIKRAETYPSCQKIAKVSTTRPITSLISKIRTKIRLDILRSVMVCGSDCLTVSFSKEVSSIRKMLNRASKLTQRYAKNVVGCSNIKRPATNKNVKENRTEDVLENAVRRTKNVVKECRICRTETH